MILLSRLAQPTSLPPTPLAAGVQSTPPSSKELDQVTLDMYIEGWSKMEKESYLLDSTGLIKELESVSILTQLGQVA